MIENQQLERYSRQLIVPEFDLEGQEALAKAAVLIVGCGGLGVPVAMYLAAAGVGRLVLVDDDEVELSNLPRQVAFVEADVGELKALVLAARLKAMNSDICIEAIVTRFTEEVAINTLQDLSAVVDATDNRNARLLIDRTTAARKLPWFMGAAVQMSGQNIAFSSERQEGCYHCLSPDGVVNKPASCRELGILGPVVGSVALTQALDVLGFLTGCSEVPWGVLRLCDFRRGENHHLMLNRRKNCIICD